jgi:hypothetical protein
MMEEDPILLETSTFGKLVSIFLCLMLAWLDVSCEVFIRIIGAAYRSKQAPASYLTGDQKSQ